MKFMKDVRIAVVGMGYVGLPLAIEFAKHFHVIGFDIRKEKIELLQRGKDPTEEVGDSVVSATKVKFTADPSEIHQCNFIVVAVPTPIAPDYQPDLSPVESATKIVGNHMPRGAVVVYESTVYPGCTEEVCIPILEGCSGFKFPVDFKVGYSPERVNPGDKVHTVDKIVKVISGCDKESTDLIREVYAKAIPAGIFVAHDIKTAEAAKVIENIQRDLNIALVNELSIIFDRLGISTRHVLDAASTKWNFHRFHPGLVGGHCIGVDPYYLVYKSEMVGYNPHIILAGRALNEYMPRYVAQKVLDLLRKNGKKPENSKVLVMGLTFKENVNDYRNSKISSTIKDLKAHGIHVFGNDPLLSDDIIRKNFAVDPGELKPTYDVILFKNNHARYAQYDLAFLKNLCASKPILVDLAQRFDKNDAERAGFTYWSL